jgi:hypothetical protein
MSGGTDKRTFVMAFDTPVTDAGKSKVHRIDWLQVHFPVLEMRLKTGVFRKCAMPFIATMLQGAAP